MIPPRRSPLVALWRLLRATAHVLRGLWIIRGAPLAKGVIPSIFVNVRTINAAFLLLRSMFQGAALGA